MEPHGYLVKFQIQGPEFEVETTHGTRSDREHLLDIEMSLSKEHAETVGSTILELLSRPGAIVTRGEP